MRANDRSGVRGADRDIWAWALPGWHAAFWLLLAVLVVHTLFIGDHSVRERAGSLAVVAVLGLAYATIGARGITTREPWRRHVYLVVLVIAIGAIVTMLPDASYFLFIAFPQAWVLSEDLRQGALYSLALAVSVALGSLANAHFERSAIAPIAASLVISMIVSLALGIWITRIFEQSEERGRLIEQLQAARGELATAYHASGVLAERERLAREIHDTLAQGFTSVVMHTQAAQAELERGRTDGVGARLAAIEATARDNLDEARALVAAFAPAGLTNATLVQALRRLADRFQAETGVEVALTFEPNDDAVAALHSSHQVVLLRAAQEGLTNVRKHAGALRVRLVVLVDSAADTAQITVTDDGVGFELSAVAASGGGFGLAGMRGRVEQVGGSIEVRSTPGHGTSVLVTVPASAT